VGEHRDIRHDLKDPEKISVAARQTEFKRALDPAMANWSIKSELPRADLVLCSKCCA
jgi:hypothetical protein